MRETREVFAKASGGTKPWSQLDRGGDAWPVLLDAVDEAIRDEHMVTIRAAYNRRVNGGRSKQLYLWEKLEREPVAAQCELHVPAGPGRRERTAGLGVRFSREILVLQDQRTKRQYAATLNAVLIRENHAIPTNEKPIEWMLLTTYPVKSADDALKVLWAYTQRWRIEGFHKVWKTGACRVEDTQLRAEDDIVKWATVLASVAMRLLRLTYFARTQPDLPATEELSDAEVQAIVLLRKPVKRKPGTPTISDAVRWMADLGGYTGKSSSGPPGPLVLARGLHYIQSVATLVAERRVPTKKLCSMISPRRGVRRTAGLSRSA